jgi:hypothetical protein
MRIKEIFFIVVLICQQNLAQTIRPEISKLANEISKYGELTSESIGYSGMESEQYIRCMKLDSLATKEELMLLVEDKSPILRCASFPALCNKDIELSTQVLIKHLTDKETVKIQSGCVGSNSSVADDFISNYVYILTQKDTIISERNKELKTKIDKQILEDSSLSLRYKTYLIQNLEQNDSNYKIIRKIALEGKEPEAIFALGKYHNSKDKSIILNAFQNENLEIGAIKATKEFPLKDFYPLITRAFNNEQLKEKYDYPKLRLLYQTLAKYPDENETLVLFDKTFSVKPERLKHMKELLWMAVTKYPNPKFENYKARLDINENDFLLLEERDLD